MRTLLIYLSLFFLSIASIHAQSMKKMAQKTEFESRLAKEAQTVESIESDFTQVKYLDVFDEKVTSKGKFYYQKSNKICMEYFRPMDYLIVINGSKLKIVSDGKKSIMNLSSNKMMAQMQDMLTACKNDKFPYDDELDDSEKNEISTEYNSVIDRKIADTKDEKINIAYDEALSE